MVNRTKYKCKGLTINGTNSWNNDTHLCCLPKPSDRSLSLTGVETRLCTARGALFIHSIQTCIEGVGTRVECSSLARRVTENRVARHQLAAIGARAAISQLLTISERTGPAGRGLLSEWEAPPPDGFPFRR